MAQYWAQITYPDESQYNMVGRRNPDNWFTRLYRDVLKDLSESKKNIEAEVA
ncbi:MAG: SusD/RagB family nutrient-binding outer membrane lipoprotein, partial [Saprospiraceae bacterium]|nr:SusD/RagB family nutrient-binding outer membrane lipoprotein [Saprospiraceae bacterium]